MKKRILELIILMIIILPMTVQAKSGCCSHYGGVAGCNSYGRQICKDGTLSPTCTCTPIPSYVYGCTDDNAKNYNSKADKDDGNKEEIKEKSFNKISENDSNLGDLGSGIVSIGFIGTAVYYIRKKIKK